MNSSEVKWLKQVKKYPNRFHIVIDGDEVYVINTDDDEIKFRFENCGNELLCQVLNQFGCKAEIE